MLFTEKKKASYKSAWIQCACYDCKCCTAECLECTSLNDWCIVALSDSEISGDFSFLFLSTLFDFLQWTYNALKIQNFLKIKIKHVQGCIHFLEENQGENQNSGWLPEGKCERTDSLTRLVLSQFWRRQETPVVRSWRPRAGPWVHRVNDLRQIT